jgi:hypothetical protein
MAFVLKTNVLQGTVGSNPTLSAKFLQMAFRPPAETCYSEVREFEPERASTASGSARNPCLAERHSGKAGIRSEQECSESHPLRQLVECVWNGQNYHQNRPLAAGEK